jgi:hypothetical protein
MQRHQHSEAHTATNHQMRHWWTGHGAWRLKAAAKGVPPQSPPSRAHTPTIFTETISALANELRIYHVALNRVGARIGWQRLRQRLAPWLLALVLLVGPNSPLALVNPSNVAFAHGAGTSRGDNGKPNTFGAVQGIDFLIHAATEIVRAVFGSGSGAYKILSAFSVTADIVSAMFDGVALLTVGAEGAAAEVMAPLLSNTKAMTRITAFLGVDLRGLLDDTESIVFGHMP